MPGSDDMRPEPRTKLTYDDFVLFPDDGMRHELIDVVEPDLLYLSNERAATVLTSTNVQGVPELVVEIGSPSTRRRDETIKRRLYERSGVSENWFVDPAHDVVRVYRAGRNGFD